MEQVVVPIKLFASMHKFRAYRNNTVKTNEQIANCPNLIVNAFITYKFKRFIMDSFVNILMFRSTKC